jgi:hypothetical protein
MDSLRFKEPYLKILALQGFSQPEQEPLGALIESLIASSTPSRNLVFSL